MVGGHLSPARVQRPFRAGSLGCPDRASGMDRRARRDCGLRQPPRVGERLDRSGAHVEKRALIGRRPHPRLRLLARQQADRGAPLPPLLRAFLEFLHAGRPDRAMERPVGNRIAGDGVPRDRLPHGCRRRAEKIEGARSIVRAESLGEFARHHPHTGVDEADIAPGAPEPDLDRLQRHHSGAGFGESERGGKAGITAADDDDIGRRFAHQRPSCGRRRRGRLPEAMRKRVVLHRRPSS